MLLAFDIGNTNIVLGVFKDKELITSWRIKTDAQKSTDEYGMIVSQLFEYEGLRMQDIDDIIISTVVPSVLFTIQHLSQRYFGINSIVVASGVKTGLKIKYDNPKQVGADRIVNAVAAYEKFGGPLIIIDFGTATTFCAISRHAEYLGGTIAPGEKSLLIHCLKKLLNYLRLNLKIQTMLFAGIPFKVCRQVFCTAIWGW